MLDWTNQQLEEIGAVITTNEIKQQPELWNETLEIFHSHKESLMAFLEGFKKETTEKNSCDFYRSRNVCIRGRCR